MHDISQTSMALMYDTCKRTMLKKVICIYRGLWRHVANCGGTGGGGVVTVTMLLFSVFITHACHWRRGAATLAGFSLLAALEIVILTISSAVGDGSYVDVSSHIMTLYIIPFYDHTWISLCNLFCLYFISNIAQINITLALRFINIFITIVIFIGLYNVL